MAKDKVARGMASSLQADVDKKVGSGILATMSDMGQDVKTAMTGGSVAVVGINSSGFPNLSKELQDCLGEWTPVTIAVNRGYVSPQGDIYTSSSISNRYATVNVTYGEVYRLFLLGVGDLPEIMFKNASGTLIASQNITSTGNLYCDCTIDVPINAVEMRINTKSGLGVWKKTPLSIQKNKDETVIRSFDDITDSFNFNQDGYSYESSGLIQRVSYPTHKTATITLPLGTYKLNIPRVVLSPMGILVNSTYLYPLANANDTNAILATCILKLTATTTLEVSKVLTGISLNTHNYEFSAYKINEQDASDFKTNAVQTVTTVYQAGNAVAVGTIFVASSTATATEKVNATYVCDGINDEVEINTAIQAIPVTGGEIKLSSGTFSILNPIIINKRVTIRGCGASVGSRAVYTPTNGNIYDNLFGSEQFAGTKIRIDANIDGIQVTTSIRGLTLKDFFLQGFGKDRHTKAGINFTTGSDVLLMDGINISDCCMCMYAYAGEHDAPTIVNCGFEWCGCGMMLNSYLAKMSNVIFCDNNGLESYNGTTIDCGGLVLHSSCGSFSNVQILRSNKYSPAGQRPIHLLVFLNSGHNTFSACYLQVASGCGIYAIDSSWNNIIGCHINDIGSANIAGKNYGIYGDATCDGWIIQGTDIGRSSGSSPSAIYHMQEAVKIGCSPGGTGHVVVGNRSSYSEVSDPFSIAGTFSIVANNLNGVYHP